MSLPAAPENPPRKAPQQAATPILLTPAQAAAALSIHVKTLYDWIAKGRLPVLNIGSDARPTLRIRYSDLENFLAERGVRRGGRA